MGITSVYRPTADNHAYAAVGPPPSPGTPFDFKFDVNGTLWFCNPLGEWIMTYDPQGGNGAVTSDTITTATTLTDIGTDQVVEIDATAAAFQVTLPPAADFKYKIDLKRISAGSNKPTFKAAGTDTIDGSTATRELKSKDQSFTLVANEAGTGWNII